MQIQKNISLKEYNTLGINATAKFFANFSTLAELEEVISFDLQHPSSTMLVIGGGSNILLTQDYNGLVARNEMKGLEVVSEDDEHVYVRAAAGENWHRFVLYCIENNFAGVENLSLIPGNVGASPMQNIGAYGVEIKDVFHQLEAYNIKERQVEIFTKKDCEFDYRESIFKRKLKGKYIITAVTFILNKRPKFAIEYGAIRQELDTMGVKELSIAAVSQAVINIRRSKLPDPARIGNAGSFFKNPLIPQQQFNDLKEKYPDIVGFAAKEGFVKVAAGWLIEQAGWKGYRKGDAGCYAQQALVLVNYGGANGIDIYNLSTEIMHSIEGQFGIILEREVNII